MLKLFTKSPPEPVLDATYGCPDARGLRKKFGALKFRAVACQLERCRDVDQQSFFVDVLADAEGRPERFDAWIASQPQCADAHLTGGAHALEWAWQARGRQRSEEVADEQWDDFYARLELAKQQLVAALACDGDSGLPYGYLLLYGRGKGWTLDEAAEAYRLATERDPIPWLATYHYLTFLCEKWFGSHELMFDLARSISNAAPEGADVHAMVAYAHIERWLYALAFDDDPHADDYWLADDVFDELIEVYKRWVNKSSSTPYEKVAANAFLFCFSSLSAREVMRVELERIGPFPSLTPWRYLGDPQVVYQNVWKVAHDQ